MGITFGIDTSGGSSDPQDLVESAAAAAVSSVDVAISSGATLSSDASMKTIDQTAEAPLVAGSLLEPLPEDSSLTLEESDVYDYSPPERLVENALFGETSPAYTVLSRALFSYDAPEVTDVAIDFVYNYFTADERAQIVTDPNQQLVNLATSNTSDLHYAVSNDDIPRYVKITFKPQYDPYAKIGGSSTRVSENIDNILIEGSTSSPYFSGVEILDTNLERNLYTMLSGSITFLNLGTNDDSVKASVERLEEALGESGGLTGDSKKLLLEAMSDLKPEGMVFAQTDVSPELAATSGDPMASQTFSVKFNNMFISDIVNRANRFPDSVFQDEMRALAGPAATMQQTVLSSIDPETVSEAEYTNLVAAISSRPSETSDEYLEDGPEITQIGYVFSKREVLPDGTSISQPPAFLDDPNGTYVLDKEVRYGGVYTYKVRTVLEIKTLIREVDTSSPVYDELVVATFLVASEGTQVTVHCVEDTHPPPPTRINVRMDHKTRLPILSWQFPLNPQRDIKRFQIFKRDSIDYPFTLLAEYNFDDSVEKTSVLEVALSKNLYNMSYPQLSYLDVGYIPGSKPIYALATVDAHGMASHLSTQYQIQYDPFRNKLSTKAISRPGAPKPYPNLLLNEDAFIDAIKVGGYDRMIVFFDPEYYRVFKNDPNDLESASLGNSSGTSIKEVDTHYLAVNPEEDTYKIHLLNVDLQKDETVNIRIADKSGSPIDLPAADISSNNLSFEFGVD